MTKCSGLAKFTLQAGPSALANSDRPQSAFTLIEVLVVVSIIAMLIAILLPALSRAKAQAYSAVCLSNEHQFGVAAHTFATEHKGWIPRGGDYMSVNWIQVVVRQMGNKNPYRVNGVRNINLIPVERLEIFHCPARQRSTPSPFLDYVVNALDSRGPRRLSSDVVDQLNGEWREVKGASRIDRWKYPSRTVYIMDAERDGRSEDLRYARENISRFRQNLEPGGLDAYDVWSGGHVPGYAEDVNGDSRWLPRAALKMHLNRGSNAVFVDGHAARIDPPSRYGSTTATPEHRYQYYLRRFGVKIVVSPPSKISKLWGFGASPEGNPHIDF